MYERNWWRWNGVVVVEGMDEEQRGREDSGRYLSNEEITASVIEMNGEWCWAANHAAS